MLSTKLASEVICKNIPAIVVMVKIDTKGFNINNIPNKIIISEIINN